MGWNIHRMPCTTDEANVPSAVPIVGTCAGCTAYYARGGCGCGCCMGIIATGPRGVWTMSGRIGTGVGWYRG